MSRTTKDKVTDTQFVTSPRAVDLGICTTCNSAPECVNLKASSRPIWHCDQFDAYEPQPDPGPRAADFSPEPVVAPNGGHEGLCQNCNYRKSCVNRVPGVAVWECEEHC
ncbi:MAG: hypothetical protein JSW71_20565 [Gemmatimonadota bacterium]|nr:MAG: hypothetical protein JSW71_20565 [Gemmatimonadota bacterium]